MIMAKRDLIRTVKRFTPVICVETGEVYQSMKEAAQALGIRNQGNMYRAIRSGGIVEGYHFKYADETRNQPVMPTPTGRV